MLTVNSEVCLFAHKLFHFTSLRVRAAKDSTGLTGALYRMTKQKLHIKITSDATRWTARKPSAVVEQQCASPLCFHGADVLHLIWATVTSWILSMLCQVADYTLSNFMGDIHSEQRSYWNTISWPEHILSFPLSWSVSDIPFNPRFFFPSPNAESLEIHNHNYLTPV